MSKKAKSEVADNSADTVMDGVLSENQAKLDSYKRLSRQRRSADVRSSSKASSTPTINSHSFTAVLRDRHFSMQSLRSIRSSAS